MGDQYNNRVEYLVDKYGVPELLHGSHREERGTHRLLFDRSNIIETFITI